jgi:hypothetical protein
LIIVVDATLNNVDGGTAGSRAMKLWHACPSRVRRALKRTGLPYAASFIARYAQRHSCDRFAGSLPELQATYAHNREARAALLKRFDAIMDSLVMPNGVTKTTYAQRQDQSLIRILDHDGCKLNTPIRVLDVPSSAGTASLNMYAILCQRYQVVSYVLGDLYVDVVCDPKRRCVFDSQGTLLQVGFDRRFFSTHRAHASGDVNTWLTRLLLIPHDICSWYLKKRYPFAESDSNVRTRLIHPEIQALAADGTVSIEKVNVFETVAGTFDVILSFNLLQRNYFPPERIALGTQNLGRALSEGGLLVLGNTESFLAYRKVQGELVRVLAEGSF